MGKERDAWYWVSHPHEGDVFYPIYVNCIGEYYMDGKKLNLVSSVQLEEGAIWYKAIMPEI